MRGCEIEAESMRIIWDLLSGYPLSAPEGDVVVRVVHASGDPGIARRLRFHPEAVERAIAALRSSRPIVTDVAMVACGIRGYWGPLAVAVEQPGVGEEAEKTAATRASMGMRQLQHLWNQGIVVVGNAPTALLEVLRLSLEGSACPMLVVGMPVGFVGAAESKDELVASGIPYITLLGTRGGSPMAAAAVNALIRAARRGE